MRDVHDESPGRVLVQLGREMHDRRDAAGGVVDLAGLARAISVNSLTDFAGTFGVTASTIGVEVTSPSIAKSFTRS